MSMHKRDKDFYSVLGVGRLSTQEEIKEAFLSLVKYLHPDKSGDVDSYHEIKQAYDVLRDPKKRKLYDALGNKGISFVQGSPTEWTHEQIDYKVSKQENKEKQTWFEENVGLVSSTEVRVAVSKESAKMTGVSLHQKTRIPIFDNKKIRLDLESLVKAEHGKHSGSFAVNNTYNHSGETSFFSQVSLATTGSRIEAGICRVLDSLTEFQHTITFFSTSLIQMQFTLLRHLLLPMGLKLKSFFSAIVTEGGINSIATGITNSFKKAYSWLAAIHVSATSIYLVSQISYQFKNKIRITLGCHAGHDESLSPITNEVSQATYNLPLIDFGLSTHFNLWSITFGILCPISKSTSVDISLQFGTTFGVIIGLSRFKQRIRIPFSCINISITAVVTSFFSSLFMYLLILLPYKRLSKKRKLDRKRLTLGLEIDKSKKWKENMKNSVETKRIKEEERGGLVVIHANYGNLSKVPGFVGPTRNQKIKKSSDEIMSCMTSFENDPEIVDVTDQLQYQVKHSELHCPQGLKKSDLPGFYDPLSGELNFLEVIYLFRESYHYVLVEEYEEVHLPMEAHRLIS